MFAVLLAARHVNEVDALTLIGWVIVIGCLIAAGVLAFRYAQYVGAVVLLLVAIVAAFLLL
jgi:hypothetical protein